MNIKRVSSLRVLGVIANVISSRPRNVLASCNSLLYALRILHCHGIPDASLQNVFQATVIAKLMHCAPAWSGAYSAANHVKSDSFIRSSKRLGYCSQNQPSLTQLLDDTDDSFFDRIKINSEHVLQPYLLERPEICYSLRERSHNKTVLTKTAYLNDQHYLIRMLYKDSYWLFISTTLIFSTLPFLHLHLNFVLFSFIVLVALVNFK